MLITKSTFPHICKLYGAFRTRVHEPVAALWVKFRCRNHLCELLHISWLYVDDIETLVLNIQIPKVYPQIVTADKGLSITINRNTVNMVSMSIGVGTPGYCSDNSIMMCKAW